MNNKEFLETLEVTGILSNYRHIGLECLYDTNINLERAYKKLYNFIKINNVDVINIEGLALHCMSILCDIAKDHIYKNGEDFNIFLDDFLKIYRLGLSECYLKDKDYLIDKLIEINLDEHKNLKMDALKIKFIMHSLKYNGKDIHVKIGFKTGFCFPKLKISEDEIYYGIVIKDGHKICLDDNRIKNQSDLFKILLKRDYDLVYLPTISPNDTLKMLESYKDYGWMNNEDYIDILKIYRVVDIFSILNTDEYERICNSKWDVKYIIKRLMLSNNIRHNIKSKTIIRFIGQLIDILDRNKEKNYNTKLTYIGDLIYHLENDIIYEDITSVTSRLFYDGGYKDLDDVINRFKRLKYSEIRHIKLRYGKNYSVRYDYIECCDNTRYDKSNSLIIYNDMTSEIRDIKEINDTKDIKDIMFIISS